MFTMMFKFVLLQILMVYGSDGRTADPVHRNLALLPSKCGQINEDRILTSIPLLDEFPWMALIAHGTRHGTQFVCTGTIINSWYILTAARCVKGGPAGVRVGDYDIRTLLDCNEGSDICESDVQDIAIAEQIIHQNFTSDESDIALLRVKEEIKFNYMNVAPICLPVRQQLQDSPGSDDRGVIVTWGLKNEGATAMRKYDVGILAQEDCQCNSTHAQVNTAGNKFCAGIKNQKLYNEAFDHSDVGGPLLIKKEKHSKYVQYGVSSQSGCDSTDTYTNVAKYVDWILDNIRP